MSASLSDTDHAPPHRFDLLPVADRRETVRDGLLEANSGVAIDRCLSGVPGTTDEPTTLAHGLRLLHDGRGDGGMAHDWPDHLAKPACVCKVALRRPLKSPL